MQDDDIIHRNFLMQQAIGPRTSDLVAGMVIGLPILFLYMFLAAKFSPQVAIAAFLAVGCIILSFYQPIVPALVSLFIIFSGIVWGLEIAKGFLPFALLSIAAWLAKKIFTLDMRFVLDRQLFYILGYLAMAIASVLVAVEDQLYTFVYLFNYVKLLAFYLLISNVIQTRKHVQTVVIVAIVATAVSLLYGFYMVFFATYAPQEFVTSARLRGLTGNANAIAVHIVLLTPILLLLIFQGGWRLKSIIYLGVVIIFSIGLVATFSRGGTIAFATVLAIVSYLKRSWKVFLALLVIMVLLAILVIPPSFWEHLQTLLDLGKFVQDESLRERMRVLTGAIDQFLKHPLLGIGVGNFILISRNYILEHLAAHNMIVHLAAETGIFGVLFFMLAFFRSVSNLQFAYHQFKRQKDGTFAAISQGMMVGFVGVFITCLFLSDQEAFILWALFGLSVAVRNVASKEQM